MLKNENKFYKNEMHRHIIMLQLSGAKPGNPASSYIKGRFYRNRNSLTLIDIGLN